MISRKNIKNFIGKVKRFGLFIPLSNLLLAYGNKIFPKKYLEKVSLRRNNLIENKLLEIISPFDFSNETEPINCVKDYKIWFMWFSGENNLPLIQEMCLQSIRKHSCGHEVVVLSLQNISKYIEIPNRLTNLYKEGRIAPANLADYIRILLLSKYGGFWMDATMYLTKPIDSFVGQSRLFSLKSNKRGYYISECRWSSFCLYTDSSSLLPHLLKKIWENYWSKENRIIDYFMLDYSIDLCYRFNKSVRDDIDSIPFSNPHLHALAPVLCQEYDDRHFKALLENTSFFKLNWKIFTDDMLLKNKNNYYHKMSELANS